MLGSLREDLIEQQKVWSMLAAVFNDLPDMSLVQGLREQMHREMQENGEASSMTGWLEGLSDGEALRALGTDRARLFRYVDASCIQPPYESLYTGESENNVLEELHAFFLESGFAPTGAYKDAADYLGMELAFLEECCEAELAAFDACRSRDVARMRAIRDGFIADHVAAWVPIYAERMKEAAQTGYYREMASALLNLILASSLCGPGESAEA